MQGRGLRRPDHLEEVERKIVDLEHSDTNCGTSSANAAMPPRNGGRVPHSPGPFSRMTRGLPGGLAPARSLFSQQENGVRVIGRL